MIFGNKADFAIEAMIEPHLKPPSIPWGRMCIWVEGKFIGDYDDPHCGLGSACQGFSEKIDELNALWLDSFTELSDLGVWNFLDALLYGYQGNEELEDDRTVEQSISDSNMYSKFDFLTNWGEMFDRDGKSFLLKQPNGYLKVLNFDYEENRVNSYQCSELSFRKAVKEFVDWYDQQEDSLGSENA